MMLRQVSGRSQRGKGNLKLKNALQISLLVAICVWLLYQMQHAHEKKKSYLEIIKFKVERDQFDIIKFSRKYGVGHGEVLEEDEEEGGAGDHPMDGMSPEEESDAFEEKDHEEASQKAREMSFKGDDASSEVVHIVHDEEEHEGGSHEARERSFTADDASSAVAHVPQSNELDLEPGNGGTRNQADSGSKDSEKKAVDRTFGDSRARSFPDSLEQSQTTHNSNATEVEQKANSIIFSKHQILDQKNSTAAGTTVVQDKSAVALAMDCSNRKGAHGDEKHNFEKGATMKQKADTTGRTEKSEERYPKGEAAETCSLSVLLPEAIRGKHAVLLHYDSPGVC